MFSGVESCRVRFGWRFGHSQWGSHGASILLGKRTVTSCLRSKRHPLSDSSMTDNRRLCVNPMKQRINAILRMSVWTTAFVKDVHAPCTTHFDQAHLILHETAVGIRHARDREVCAWRLAQSFVFLCLLQFSEVLLAFAL